MTGGGKAQLRALAPDHGAAHFFVHRDHGYDIGRKLALRRAWTPAARMRQALGAHDSVDGASSSRRQGLRKHRRAQPLRPVRESPESHGHSDSSRALPFQFRFAAKKQLFRYPFLGWHLRRSGHVPIDRENPHAAVKSLREAVDTIKEGTPVVIFPEGATSRDGSIKPFKGGGFMLATKSQVAAVPVTIRGSRAVLVPRTYHVRGGSVEVIIGRPIVSTDVTAVELANRVREEVLATFKNGKTLDRNSYSLSRQD